ncbi:hypothetical protein ARMSODRAFT_961255 [Armillaria solidipes]|uniref:Uncharacterized protein n=1 Tax=Armillaria solidipes TaxID=1076256 RepID=A0A2H3B8N9_9AGAR|nr:hypothetical protein ARMSODRAFT_961255 [Armillaria solidipes]
MDTEPRRQSVREKRPRTLVLSDCICGRQVEAEEQDIAARCTERGCETIWVSFP